VPALLNLGESYIIITTRELHRESINNARLIVGWQKRLRRVRGHLRRRIAAMGVEKSWQARIGEGNDALAQSFVESISFDRRLAGQDIRASLAHARMLRRVGLLTAEECQAIEEGLGSIQRDIEAGKFEFDPALEDIHMVIEDALIRRTGDAGRKLHTGRSRNDQVAVDVALWITDAVDGLGQRLHDVCRALVDLAGRSIDVVMPSYTHLQRAQPISAAAECLAWCRMLDNDRKRLTALRHDRSELYGSIPLGGGAIAGTSLPIDPKLTAAELGFTEPTVSSIEQTASRDQAIELAFAVAMTGLHLSRWAEQWVVYLSSEFSFIKIADRYTTGSSMMPQKRNPDMLELIRGRSGNLIGHLVGMLTTLKGLPIGYNRDLQEDKRQMFAACDMLDASLAMAAAVIGSAEFCAANIEPTLERGFLDATSLAEYLVVRGVPFRTAHQVVGGLVAACEKQGLRSLSELGVAAMRREAEARGIAATAIGDDVTQALGARNVVRRYRSAGAAGGAPLAEQLANWQKQLSQRE
jgi:argininosuccinate lyase